MPRCIILALLFIASTAFAAEPTNARPPKDDADLRYWLESMLWHHRFTNDEITAATGLSADAIQAACAKFDIREDNRPARPANALLLVLPYPGGRHPRIGFLEGAIDPQRETKFSVFTPWSEKDYVVVDVPEAIWSNLGLTYLAHTHIDTIWSKQKIAMERLEWNRKPDGALAIQRRLPNGIEFGTKVTPQRDAVRMELWLKNGTAEKLSDLRVQNCIMLKSAAGFDAQTTDNKLLRSPFACCHDAEKKRWIITAWLPAHRMWGNAKCPCLHSDPKFPDCAPGETQVMRGWLSFYEGTDIDAELARITKLLDPAGVNSIFSGAKAGEEREVAGVKLCWCPPGKFLMGSPATELERRPGEDQIEVTLSKGFWAGKFEVTQAQWKRVVGEFPGERTAGEGDDFPVYTINFAEAEEFCKKLTDLAHASGELLKDWAFRLPTDAQWEYACRAGTTTATYFGQSLSSKQANFQGKPYNGAEEGPSLKRTAKVGSYPANAWGLHDTLGNVFEWCRDWHHAKLPGGVDPDLYSARATALINRTGDASRVRRGGCWADEGWPCRAAFRLRFEPARRHDHIGFRVVAVKL